MARTKREDFLRQTRQRDTMPQETLGDLEHLQGKFDFDDLAGHIGGAIQLMKNATKIRKSSSNGRVPTRRELLAAHERWLKRVRRMTKQEGFESLVRAGIVTPEGKLAPRYGG